MSEKKLVEKIPIDKIWIEVSLDQKSANIFFADKKGKEYTLKYYDGFKGTHDNLSIQEL